MNNKKTIKKLIRLLASVAGAIIDSMKKRNRYETENPQPPSTALLR